MIVVECDGYPADAVAGHAAATNADPVVVGGRGGGGVASPVAGSTSLRLIPIANRDLGKEAA